AKGAVDSRQSDSCRALYIVIIGANLIPVPLQDRNSVEIGKIFPLNAAGRKKLLDCAHKLIDKRVVFRSANTMLSQPKVKRILQQGLVIGPYIERDRQRKLWRNAGTRRVKGKLANRNAHAAHAEIA